MKARMEDNEQCIAWEVDLKQTITDLTQEARKQLKAEMVPTRPGQSRISDKEDAKKRKKKRSKSSQSNRGKKKDTRGRKRSVSRDGHRGHKAIDAKNQA